MLRTVLTAAALGIAGFDPLGVVALVAALALGASRRAVAVLTAVTLASTALFGILPALVLGPAVDRLWHLVHHIGHQVWGALVLGVGVGLLAWAVWRVLHPATGGHEEGRTPKSTGVAAMATTGVLVGLSAFIDPAFYAGIVFAAGQHHVVQKVLVVLVWVAMSQSALIVVAAAALLGLYGPVSRLVVAVQTRWARAIALTLTVLLVAFGIFCLVQGIAELRGDWIHVGRILHHRG